MECAPGLLGQGLGQAADERDPAGRRLPAARRRGHGGGGRRPNAPNFRIVATGTMSRALPKMWRSTLRGEQLAGPVDARGIQPFLTYRLSRSVNAGLTIHSRRRPVELPPVNVRWRAARKRLIYLPRASALPRHVALAFLLGRIARTGGKDAPMKNCLVVEDSRVMRTVARRIFEELHFDIGEAEDGMGGAARLPRQDARSDLPGLEHAVDAGPGIRQKRARPAERRPSRDPVLPPPRMMPTRSPHAIAAGANDYRDEALRPRLAARQAGRTRAACLMQPTERRGFRSFSPGCCAGAAAWSLTAGKGELLERRLKPVMRRFGFQAIWPR